MGRLKQFEIEFQEQQMAEFNELEEMNLEESILDLKNQLEDAQSELNSDEISDLENQILDKQELFERYKELAEKYSVDNKDI